MRVRVGGEHGTRAGDGSNASSRDGSERSNVPSKTAPASDLPDLLHDWARRSRRPPRRVFLSHASERNATVAERGFVAAARTAVIRAGDAMIDMAYFTAQTTDPAEYCVRMITTADVYVGIIGLRYGSAVRGRPDLSHIELEFEAATAIGLPRLVFLLAEETESPPHKLTHRARSRQAAFRRRVRNAGLTIAYVTSPTDLEARVYQALIELRPDDQSLTDLVRRTVLLMHELSPDAVPARADLDRAVQQPLASRTRTDHLWHSGGSLLRAVAAVARTRRRTTSRR